jgi:hypothetical protein
MTLKDQFEQITAAYVSLFEKKQDMEGGYWIGEAFGGMLDVADMFFSFEDIRLDVDNDIEPGLIVKWYYWRLEEDRKANYRSWLKLNGHFPTNS